jgi:hypothetical protein
MKNLNTIAALGGAAASVMLMAAPADAALITQTITLSSLLTDWTARSSTFNLFDTNLGTLTKVDLTFKFAASSTLSVANNDPSNSSSGTAAFSSSLALAGSSAAMTTAVNTALGAFDTVDPDNPGNLYIISKLSGGKNYSLAAGGSTSLSASFSTQTISGSLTAAGDLSLFSFNGTGTDNFFNDTFTTTSLSNKGGNTSATQTTLANGSYTIVYTYDAAPPPPPPPPPTGTPEPASMAMLGMGLIGLGAAVRRRRKV